MATDGRRPEEHTRIFLRPIGSGLPLGFFAFALGMLLLGCFAIGWVPAGEQKDVGMLLMSFVFPLELVATIVAFLARDTLGATTLGLFTTSWLALGWADLEAVPGSTSVALGVYLFGFAAVVFLLALLSTLAKPFFTLLLLVASARMVLAGVFEAGGGTGWDRGAGGVAIGLTTLALYGGVALALEDARQREVLPLYRRGGAARAFEGFDAQLERLEGEPGVRQQL
jgi:uncharacterized protein